MFLRELKHPVGALYKNPGSSAKNLARLGITTIAGLLLHLPRDYEDRTTITALSAYATSPKIYAKVTVLAHEWFGYGKMRTLKLIVADDSAKAELLCFNRGYLESRFVPGTQALVYGAFQFRYGRIQAGSFEIEALTGAHDIDPPGQEGDATLRIPLRNPSKTPGLFPADSATGSSPRSNPSGIPGSGSLSQQSVPPVSTGMKAQPKPQGSRAMPTGLLPVYPLSEGVTQKTLRTLVQRAMDRYGHHIENEVPAQIMAAHKLHAKAEALLSLHFPHDAAEAEEARRTLAWEELFYFQLAVARRSMYRRQIFSKRTASTGLLERRLRDRLSFELTPDQDRVCKEIAADMGGQHPMARLLQGDVGSGKTLVALVACLHAVEAGGQAAILAPTELLARQHAATAAVQLEPLGLRLAFLSGSTDDGSRRHVLEELADGKLDIVLGTHALFSSDVVFKNLRLVVVDEQHRFGVLQRMAMGRKGETPDLLMMTATPIPRTLALTVYGDLTVSTIKTMPPGRKPIVTHLAARNNAQKVYDFVRRLLSEGRQAYFVYPLIEENGSSDLKDAVSMAGHLATEVFQGFTVGLIHSKLKEPEKRAVMDSFVKGQTAILVSTTVVEVGVDVPNAAAMVVEHAERFGLAALHQLRGRVGRGKDQSYCFLVYAENLTEYAKKRLRAMHETSDGFVLAEEDLRMRGPGELTGTAQSGALSLAIADPLRDVHLLEEARIEAFGIAERDPGLLLPEHTVIRQVLERAAPFGENGVLPGQ